MNLKHVRYFLVVDDKNCLYIKLKSKLPFSVKEAKDQLKLSYPKSKTITHIVKEKTEGFLNLFN